MEYNLKEDGYLIQHIENPTEEQQIEAVTENPHSIMFIKNATKKVVINPINPQDQIKQINRIIDEKIYAHYQNIEKY